MKYVIGIVLFASQSFVLLAQKKSTIEVAATYEFVHQIDSLNPSSTVKKTMLLQVVNGQSKYVNKMHYTNMAKARAANAVGNAASATAVIGGPIAMVNSAEQDTEEICQLITTRQLVVTQGLGFDVFAIFYPLPSVAWTLLADKKTIQGFTCQKAEGFFAGRWYTVWFAPELPYSFGPWKFSGLPGLILEASDSKQQVKFTCIQVQKRPNEEWWTDYKQAIPTTAEKFAKAKRKFEKDPLAVVTVNVPGNYNGEIPLVYTDASGNILEGDAAKKAIADSKKIIFNNPLELTP